MVILRADAKSISIQSEKVQTDHRNLVFENPSKGLGIFKKFFPKELVIFERDYKFERKEVIYPY